MKKHYEILKQNTDLPHRHSLQVREESFCDEIMIDIQMRMNGKVDGKCGMCLDEDSYALVPKACGRVGVPKFMLYVLQLLPIVFTCLKV